MCSLYEIFQKWGWIKTNRLYERLKNLVFYCENVDLQTPKIDLMEKTQTSADSIFIMRFKSQQGDVLIDLCKGLHTCQFYSLKYTNYAGVVVFCVESTQETNEVYPTMGTNLTAKDIDLAILELEQHFKKYFGNIELLKQKVTQSKKEECKQHEKELAKLF